MPCGFTRVSAVERIGQFELKSIPTVRSVFSMWLLRGRESKRRCCARSFGRTTGLPDMWHTAASETGPQAARVRDADFSDTWFLPLEGEFP
jgi:hypothetical protein